MRPHQISLVFILTSGLVYGRKAEHCPLGSMYGVQSALLPCFCVLVQ